MVYFQRFMKPITAKRLRLLASAVSVLLLIALAFATWFYFKMRASLPLLDGQAVIAGLSAPVTVARDALGVPVIRGANRLDVARALGVPIPIDANQTRLGARNIFFDYAKAWERLGPPEVDMRRSVEDTYVWYAEHGYIGE